MGKEETPLSKKQRHKDENMEGIGASMAWGRSEEVWRGGGELAAAVAAGEGEGQRSPNLVRRGVHL